MAANPSSGNRRYARAMRLVLPALLLVAACGGDDSSGGPDAAPYGTTWTVTGTLAGGEGCPETLELVVENVDTDPVVVGRDDIDCGYVVRSTNGFYGLSCSDAPGGDVGVSIEIAEDGDHAGMVYTLGVPCDGLYNVTATIEGG